MSRRTSAAVAPASDGWIQGVAPEDGRSIPIGGATGPVSRDGGAGGAGGAMTAHSSSRSTSAFGFFAFSWSFLAGANRGSIFRMKSQPIRQSSILPSLKRSSVWRNVERIFSRTSTGRERLPGYDPAGVGALTGLPPSRPGAALLFRRWSSSRSRKL